MTAGYLHNLAADGGLQCTIVIWQVRQLDLLGLHGQRERRAGVRYGNRRCKAPGRDALEASGMTESAREHPCLQSIGVDDDGRWPLERADGRPFVVV